MITRIFFCGWHQKGIKRYDELVWITNSNRETAKSKRLETKLRLIYDKLRWKGKGRYDSDVERQEIDSNRNDDDIEMFIDFAGGINISNVSHIEVL